MRSMGTGLTERPEGRHLRKPETGSHPLERRTHRFDLADLQAHGRRD